MAAFTPFATSAGAQSARVDDAGWHFVDASGETIILVGLKPGAHKVLIELADPTHQVITSQAEEFTVPDPSSP